MSLSIITSQPEQLALAFQPGLGPEITFARVFRRLGLKRAVPRFRVEYHAFAGLRSNIRLRDTEVQIGLSDLLADAPPLVLEALAEILLAKLFRCRASREAQECYLAYVCAPTVQRRVDEARRQRGAKRFLPPQGQAYNLDEIFARLNRRFFHGGLAKPRLGWSLRRSRTLLGHYDSAHGTITISRWLDSRSVPRYLVEYLVFHEMLHMRYRIERDGHRRVLHSKEFRKAEKKFPKYEQARRQLRHICA